MSVRCPLAHLKVDALDSAFKVAIPCTGAGHIRRGVEAWATSLAEGLAERGVDVTLFKGGGVSSSAYERAVPCIRRDARVLGGVSSRVAWKKRYILEQLSFFPSFLLMARNRFDIIHLGDVQLGLLAVRLSRHGALRSKVILNNGTGVGLDLCSKFPYVQCVAPYYREEAAGRGIDVSNWFVIPHFVDTMKFRPDREAKAMMRKRLEIREDALVVLSVGSIDKGVKQMHRVIEETYRVKKEDGRGVVLVLVGQKSPETEEVRSLCRARFQDDCKILVDVPYEEMPAFYEMADVFVLATLQEGFGLALLEAMASGLPVVVNDFPVHRWIIGEGGETVDVLAEGALAMAIEKYLVEDVRLKVGTRARMRAQASFSKETVLKQIMQMYSNIMGA